MPDRDPALLEEPLRRACRAVLLQAEDLDGRRRHRSEPIAPVGPGTIDAHRRCPRDGLVHISQLAVDRVAKTTDVVKEGQKVWVKLMGFDERGKVRLSMKVVDQETGKEIAQEKKKEEADAE